MKAEELRGMADDELARKLAETKEELFNLRFQLVTGQQVRKDVARIMTVMRQRELAVLEGATAEEA